ncbi:MAG: PorP/SprF family type IX secretion system membrane protein [Hymenobacteraceae bacterium]|nr:PorP/SprF family type IX secretion system membrane protein [Hymenobacteraceae bacterium]
MQKRLLLAICLLALAFGVNAQQQPQFSHYGFNGMFLSPAYAGITNHPEFTFLGRYQYAGYTAAFNDKGGSPQTYLLTGSVPVAAIGGGLGFGISRDEIAAVKTLSAQVSYSYHIKLKSGKLGIGIQGIFNNISNGDLRPRDLNDPFVPSNSSDRKFDAGAGLWYHSESFYLGAGINNLLAAKYRFEARDADNNKLPGTPAVVSGERHAYLTTGYNIALSEAFILTPTAIGKMDFAGAGKSFSFEAGARGTFNDRFWLGVGYRHQESATALAGVAFGRDNMMRVGYAFDLVVFNPNARARSSHELLLSLRLPEPVIRFRPAIRTPRYSF